VLSRQQSLGHDVLAGSGTCVQMVRYSNACLVLLVSDIFMDCL
jgi:hypothetical protein